MSRILIVDDEENLRRILSVLLRDDGHEVVEAAGVAEAAARMAADALDLVITDQKMADGDGLEVLALAQRADPTLPVMFLTAFASVDLAVQAMRSGAFDFVTKPFVPEVVRAAVRRACERADLLRENERLKTEVRRLGRPGLLLGDSEVIRAVRDSIARVAPTHATVLLAGETGTGKELAARAIHEQSPRSQATFVAVNCAAFPETLLESELFGHERGAFTGADRARQGLFETAHRGTLLLDEAGEMSPALQAKLLRVLTDGSIYRVGSNSPRTVDVRLVAATHRDLMQRVREGMFREDLYYRIAVVPIRIPPLRERMDDLPLLVSALSTRIALELKTAPKPIRPEALAKLRRYRFPGNVRELRNLLERAFILAREDAFGPDDFPVEAEPAAPGGAPRRATDADPVGWVDSLPPRTELRSVIEEIERAMLERALRDAGGVQAEAARSLGLSRSDMNYKVRKHRIVRES